MPDHDHSYVFTCTSGRARCRNLGEWKTAKEIEVQVGLMRRDVKQSLSVKSSFYFYTQLSSSRTAVRSNSGFILRESNIEQETLLNTLHEQSTVSNRRYTLAFTLLPLLATPIFLASIIFPATTTSPRHPQPQASPARIRLLSLLAITSLLATAFRMYFLSTPVIPEKQSARETLLNRAAQQQQKQQQHRSSNVPSRRTPKFTSTWSAYHLTARDHLQHLEGRLDDIRLSLDTDGPLLQVLPWLNAAICVLLALSAWILLARRGNEADSGAVGNGGRDTAVFPWMLLVPGFMACAAALVGRVMTDERRELDRLAGLRYTFKGA